MTTIISDKVDKIFYSAKKLHLKITCAESCTGGLLSATLTNFPGVSDFFEQGFITYSNKSKEELLNVSSKTLQKVGAVSAETAYEMAKGAIYKAGVDLALSITGVAGPGSSEAKPVGLVYIGLAYLKDSHIKINTHCFNFKGTRTEIRLATVEEALNLLLLKLKEIEQNA